MLSPARRCALTPAHQRAFDTITAELSRLIRYDDESVVHQHWLRQRYDGGYAASYEPARKAAVRTAWHEAGHAVAALALGAPFSSASIRHGRDTQGRVHGIGGDGEHSFVIDAAGQIAEAMIAWTLPADDAELAAWLAGWRADGGDARRFRHGSAALFPGDEPGAWRFSEGIVVPLRPKIRQVARALLVYPRHLPYPVVGALADAATGGAGRGGGQRLRLDQDSAARWLPGRRYLAISREKARSTT
ncbi:MAG TPA: hypothetical protein VF843_01745 [Streptosporangiaceae bacterium]